MEVGMCRTTPQEQRGLIESLTDTGVQIEAGLVDLELDGERLISDLFCGGDLCTPSDGRDRGP